MDDDQELSDWRARRMREIDSLVEAGRPKRRYRRRRYLKDLTRLRPVTEEILNAYAERIPGRAGAKHELICFAVDDKNESVERLAIVAFGYDQICHVVDLGYRAGDGEEKLPHRVDLHRLKWSVARRQMRNQRAAANELSVQLLIRFIVDLNHRLLPNSPGGGAFMRFREAWKVLDLTEPTKQVRERIRHRLETIVWSDLANPVAQKFTVYIYTKLDEIFADPEELLELLLDKRHPELGSYFWSDDLDLLTSRFFLLAWLVLDAADLASIFCTDWDRTGDHFRSGGFTSGEEAWEINIRAATPGRRARAAKHMKPLVRAWLRSARQKLLSATADLEDAKSTLERKELRSRKLQPWAESRWGASNQGRLSGVMAANERRLERERFWNDLMQSDFEHAQQRVELLDREFTTLSKASLHQVANRHQS